MSKPSSFYLCFNEGVVWNFCHEEEVALDWLDRGIIECFAKYEPVENLRFKD